MRGRINSIERGSSPLPPLSLPFSPSLKLLSRAMPRMPQQLQQQQRQRQQQYHNFLWPHFWTGVFEGWLSEKARLGKKLRYNPLPFHSAELEHTPSCSRLGGKGNLTTFHKKNAASAKKWAPKELLNLNKRGTKDNEIFVDQGRCKEGQNNDSPWRPTISATCSDEGTGTHSVMFWLRRPFRSSRLPPPTPDPLSNKFPIPAPRERSEAAKDGVWCPARCRDPVVCELAS